MTSPHTSHTHVSRGNGVDTLLLVREAHSLSSNRERPLWRSWGQRPCEDKIKAVHRNDWLIESTNTKPSSCPTVKIKSAHTQFATFRPQTPHTCPHNHFSIHGIVSHVVWSGLRIAWRHHDSRDLLSISYLSYWINGLVLRVNNENATALHRRVNDVISHDHVTPNDGATDLNHPFRWLLESCGLSESESSWPFDYCPTLLIIIIIICPIQTRQTPHWLMRLYSNYGDKTEKIIDRFCVADAVNMAPLFPFLFQF